MRSKTGTTIFLAALALGVGASTASAQSGGTAGPVDPSAPTTPATPPSPTTPSGAPATVPGTRAKLTKSGLAIPPADAPQAVIDAINAGNRIRKKPYIWGGGHASFQAKGYDCSGAVSYVLNAAGLLESPMPSGPLMKWGVPGRGSWITVYANPGHTYAVIAGLRWDTSAMGSGGNGPRWRATKRSASGFAVRTYTGF